MPSLVSPKTADVSATNPSTAESLHAAPLQSVLNLGTSVQRAPQKRVSLQTVAEHTESSTEAVNHISLNQ